jgi:hypothetical protein
VPQLRENYEVTSAIYIIKNDLKGHCFLDYWRRSLPPSLPPLISTSQIPSSSNFSRGNYCCSKSLQWRSCCLIASPHCPWSVTSLPGALLLPSSPSGPELAQCFRSPYSTNADSDYTLLIRNKLSASLGVVPLTPYLTYYNLTHSTSATSTMTDETTALLKAYPPWASQVIELNHIRYGYPEYGCLHRYV